MSGRGVKKEDYEEPACLLCADPYGKEPKQIPIGRALAKLDEYTAKRDTEGALRHIAYWIAEAEAGKDKGGKLTLLNERMGVLRKAGRHEEAIGTAKEALALADEPIFAGGVIVGTTYLNAGTVMSAADKPAEALPLYEKAEEIYKAALPKGDLRLAGLYNNKAVVLMRLGRTEEALNGYKAALEVLEGDDGTLLDRAVTYANLANLYEEQLGLEEGEQEIARCLRCAQALLDDGRVVKDAYAAFVYEKCAPTFLYYGWFAYAEELNERSKKIYEGT